MASGSFIFLIDHIKSDQIFFFEPRPFGTRNNGRDPETDPADKYTSISVSLAKLFHFAFNVVETINWGGKYKEINIHIIQIQSMCFDEL